MEHAETVRALGPCGLHCGACVAFAHGDIRRHAEALQGLLGPNFAGYARRFEAMNPVFAQYPGFRDLLGFLASGSCTGCRDRGCLLKECPLPACVRERGVDFCFQCPDFPCERPDLPEFLAQRWRANNEAMRDMGVEAYYARIRCKPRYP